MPLEHLIRVLAAVGAVEIYGGVHRFVASHTPDRPGRCRLGPVAVAEPAGLPLSIAALEFIDAWTEQRFSQQCDDWYCQPA